MSGVEKTSNVGVMGCANIATRSLLPAFQKHERFNVYAVASRSMDKAERVAVDYHCKAYGNYDDLVSDKDIDLIYMPLPTGLHYEWGKKVLQSGKHLLSEKSLACSFSEVKDLVGIAKNNHLLLMESFQFRFHTQTQWVRDVVNSGKLGEIRCFRSSFGFPPFKDADNIRYQKELGGGALLDAGAYTIKSMKVILPNEEFAFKSASMITPAGSEVDLYGGAFFESENGVVAELAYGFDNYYQCGFEIWGSKGKLTSTRAYTAPAGFQPKIFVETDECGKEEVSLPSCDQFDLMLNHIVSCLDKGNFEQEYEQDLIQAEHIEKIRNYCVLE